MCTMCKRETETTEKEELANGGGKRKTWDHNTKTEARELQVQGPLGQT